MKKNLLYLIILLLTVTDGCRCGSGDNPAAPAVAPEVKIVVPASQIPPGDFSLTIDITDAVNAAGILFRLNYNPKIIQLKNKDNPKSCVTEGTFFNQDTTSTGLAVGFLDKNSDSCLVLGLSRAGGKAGINGSGTIMKFTFTTVSAGSTSIKFSETAAENSLFSPEDPLGNIPSVKWTNAELTVK